MIPSDMASGTTAQTTPGSARADDREFSCPLKFCDCYVVPGRGCTKSEQSSLYDGMVSHLTGLVQLDLENCQFQDIPKDAFRGLASLDTLIIKGARLVGHVDPEFTRPIPRLKLLEILFSHVTFLPPFCGLRNLRTVNVSYNQLVDMEHVGIKCVEDPLLGVEILDVNYNNITAFPPWLGDSVPNLIRISSGDNAITEVDSLLCDKLTKLMFLDLTVNRLSDVTRVNIRKCSRLRILALGSNPLGALPAGAFDEMESLQHLYLFSMGLNDNVWTMIMNLTYLNVLELQNNSLVTVSPVVMRDLSALQALNLSLNNIRDLPKKAFVTQYRLRSLDLSSNGMFNNMLTSVSDDTFLRMGALERVDLSGNRLLNVPPMSGLFSLVNVDLSHNNLTTLPSSMFTGLHNLTAVNLRGNRLTSLSTKTFHDCSNLRYLDLSHNRIPALKSSHFLNVYRLEHLDLSHNTFTTIGPMFKAVKLRTLLLSGNHLKQIYRGEVRKHVYCKITGVPGSVEVLDLSLNQIFHISPFTFTTLRSIRKVNLTYNDLTSLSANSMEISFTQVVYSQPVFYLKGNPLRCDCNLGWLKDWSLGHLPNSVVPLPDFNDLDELHCRSGLVTENQTSALTLTERERSEFVCVYSRDCGQGCWSDLDVLPSAIPDAATEILLDGNNLGTLLALSFIAHAQAQILRLNNSDIHSIENNTFRGLQRLKTLYLQENFLSVVFNQTFKDLGELEFLYLQDNEISFIEEGAFAYMKNLKILNLERNSLVTLSFSDFAGAENLVSLHLGDNWWSCGPNFTCSFFQFLANTSAVKNVKKLLCYDFDENLVSDARRTNGTPVLNVPLGECGENLTDYLNITREVSQSLHAGQRLSALVIVSVLSVLAIVCLVAIYVNRHLLQVWCFTKFGWRMFKMAPGGEDKDRPYDAFVSYSNLDEQFVVQELAPRLENGYKHFKLCLHYRDFPVGASIAETIVKCVEEPANAPSSWCPKTFWTASVDETKLDQTLKLYMRTRTYLKYDDPWFWEKLMFAMPDKKTEKFERLPSTRDLEYMARVGRTPTKTVSTSGSPSNGHVSVVTEMVRNDMYEVPVASVASYERVNESMSMSSSLYNGSVGTGSGHYEEVTPRAISLQPMNGNSSQNSTPPPLPPLPKKGLLPHEAVKNSSKEMLTRDENWV
nr:hypothetical protein BaRGS_013752 [Batillaria attramentaria]